MVNDETKFLHLRLKVARIARGYKNRTAFINFSKIPLTTYRAHEMGTNELKASDVVRYARLLDVSVAWLLTGEGHALAHKEKFSPEEKLLFEYFFKNEIKQ